MIADAVTLARETPFSYGDWCQALARIGDRPDREALICAVRDIAVVGASSLDYATWLLLGDENTPGVLNAYQGPA